MCSKAMCPDVLVLEFLDQSLNDDYVKPFRSFLSKCKVSALLVIADGIAWPVYKTIMVLNKGYTQIGVHKKGERDSILALLRLNPKTGQLVLVSNGEKDDAHPDGIFVELFDEISNELSDRKFDQIAEEKLVFPEYAEDIPNGNADEDSDEENSDETLAILFAGLKRVDIQVNDIEEIECIAEKWRPTPDVDVTIGVAGNQNDMELLAKLCASFLVECAVFRAANFLHDSIEIRMRERIYTAWTEVRIKSAAGMQAIKLLPPDDIDGNVFKYNVVVESNGQKIDFSSISIMSKDKIEVMQIETINDVVGFLLELSANADKWSVVVVKGRIDMNVNQTPNPLDGVVKSKSLQYILLLGRVKLPFALPDGVEQLKDTSPCYHKLGQTKPSTKEKEICLSVTQNVDFHDELMKKPCTKYDLIVLSIELFFPFQSIFCVLLFLFYFIYFILFIQFIQFI